MKKAIIIIFATILSTAAYAASPSTPRNVEIPVSEAEALFSVTGEQIVAQAQQYLGRPYRRGSKGPSAFDCSGFTSYVYKSLNIRLNSCSRSQYTEGISVNKDEVHTGDLVFFSGRNSKGGVGHVGIVIEVKEDGSFNFIHASCSQGVTVSNSTEAYYNNRYRGARRILDDYSDVLALNK